MAEDAGFSVSIHGQLLLLNRSHSNCRTTLEGDFLLKTFQGLKDTTAGDREMEREGKPIS